MQANNVLKYKRFIAFRRIAYAIKLLMVLVGSNVGMSL